MNCKNVYKEIGKRFKENRETQKLTQAELAEKVGTSVTYISSVERGLSFPRGDKLVAILNALNWFRRFIVMIMVYLFLSAI